MWHLGAKTCPRVLRKIVVRLYASIAAINTRYSVDLALDQYATPEYAEGYKFALGYQYTARYGSRAVDYAYAASTGTLTQFDDDPVFDNPAAVCTVAGGEGAVAATRGRHVLRCCRARQRGY